MSRPKLKEKDKKRGISVSLSLKTLKLLRKVPNISSFIERLVIEEFKKFPHLEE